MTLYKIALLLILALYFCFVPAAIAGQRSEEYLAKPFLESIKSHNLATAFLESIKSRNFKSLQLLTPTLSMWRQELPDELKNLSDKELKARIEKSMIGDLRKAFNNILKDAKAKHIDLAQLEFLSAELRERESKENAPKGLEISYSYKGKKDSFALSVIEIEGEYYLTAILRRYRGRSH